MFELVDTKETTDTCLFENCDKKVTSRGLCHSHYAVALRIVKKVKGMTWNKLEKNGKCLPARPPFNGVNGASTQRDWFLEGFNGKATKKQPKEEKKPDDVEIETCHEDTIKIVNSGVERIHQLVMLEVGLLKKDIKDLMDGK
jgi:hypothetical protein